MHRQSTALNVLIVNAGQPLVQAGGAGELSETYYDAIRASEVRTLDHIAFYDFNLCGGEPYANWN